MVMLVSEWWTWNQGPWTPSRPPEGRTQAGIATPPQTPIVEENIPHTEDHSAC